MTYFGIIKMLLNEHFSNVDLPMEFDANLGIILIIFAYHQLFAKTLLEMLCYRLARHFEYTCLQMNLILFPHKHNLYAAMFFFPLQKIHERKFSHACLEFTYLIKLPGNVIKRIGKKNLKNIHKVTKSSEKKHSMCV